METSEKKIILKNLYNKAQTDEEKMLILYMMWGEDYIDLEEVEHQGNADEASYEMSDFEIRCIDGLIGKIKKAISSIGELKNYEPSPF